MYSDLLNPVTFSGPTWPLLHEIKKIRMFDSTFYYFMLI